MDLRHLWDAMYLRSGYGDHVRHVYVTGAVFPPKLTVIQCTVYGHQFQAGNHRILTVYGRLRTVLFDLGSSS